MIFPFFKQCNPLKITLQNFEIDKKKFARLKFETIIYFTAEFDPILFFKHLNMIVICFSILTFQKYFLFKSLTFVQYKFSQLNVIQFFSSNTWIWLLFFFQFWHFKNIFYSKFCNCFNIFFQADILIHNFFKKHLFTINSSNKETNQCKRSVS